LGRVEGERWAPREIDIDILAIGERAYEFDRLRVPHSGLTDRPFALLPLADLAPTLRLPDAHGHPGATYSELARRWRHPDQQEVPFRTRRAPIHLTELVGIMNITPDSFSGGAHGGTESALALARNLREQGASVIDLGAESTRPGATPVAPDEEWARLAPVLQSLREQLPELPISIDTRHAETARRACDAGAAWINDVTGFADPAMRALLKDTRVRGVVMHSLGVPPTREVTLDLARDPVEQLRGWAAERIDLLERQGISGDRLLFDPGLGFGKTSEQSFEILGACECFRDLGVPLFMGHSRKSFLNQVTTRQASERDLETSALSLLLAKQGADYLRVHDVGMTERALRAGLEADGVIVWRES
jgi:dihydropteroate synthase